MFSPTKSHQTTVKDLIYDRYEDVHRKSDYFKELFTNLKRELPEHKTDPDFLDDYAYVLVRMGRLDDAITVYRMILKTSPDRFSTLCSLAGVLEIQRKFDGAWTMLNQAAQLNPKLRSGAEQIHLRFLDFRRHKQADPDYDRNHLPIDELTPFWREHNKNPGSLRKADLPSFSSESVAEVLHQLPTFGDGWLVLAILLEHEGDMHLAKLAYVKAEKLGTGQAASLGPYLKAFETYENETSSVTTAGRGMLRIILIVVAWFVITRIIRFIRNIQAERALARKPGQGTITVTTPRPIDKTRRP